MGEISVLHVEDDPQVRDLVASYLERGGDVTVESAPHAERGVAALDSRQFDCVVSDHRMPGADGIEFLREVRETAPDLPFVFYTGEGSEDVAAEAVELEVDGYIRKGGADKLKLLEARIRDATADFRIAATYREYKTVIESLNDPVYVLDEEGKITDVNDAFVELTGYDEAELLGREMSVVKTPEMVAKSERHLRSLLSEEEPDEPLFEVEIRTADGRTITCEDHMGVIPFENDQFRGSVGTLRNVEERKQRERELRRERDRFRTLFENTPAAAVHAELDGDTPIVLMVNQEFERVFGWDASEVVGEDLDALLAPEGDAVSVDETTRELRETGRVSTVARRMTADGPRLFRVEVVLRNPDEETPEGYATYLDVSDIQAVQSQERALIERMADGLFAVNENWEVTAFNERGSEVLREAADGNPDAATLRGRSLWEIAPDAVGTEFEDQYRTAMETQESVSFEAYYPPLEQWFEVRTYPSADGLSIHFQDVTDDRARRAEIAQREETLRTVYEAVSDTSLSFEQQVERLLEIGVEVLDAEYGSLSRVENGEYVFEVTHGPNDAFDERGRLALSETVCERVTTAERTVTFSDLARDEPALAERELADGRDVACYVGTPVIVDDDVYGVFCFYASDARSRFTEWEVTLVDLMGRLVGYALHTRTARDALERQNDRLEELASVLSHDLRNPLSVAQGNLDLARETGEAEFFDKTAHALDRIEELITDLLALAREGGEVESYENVSLADVAEQSWGTVSTGTATLAVETDAVVRADPSRLKRVFENLYRNALEHAGAAPRVVVTATADGFAVADDGPGIPVEDRARVFESGVSTGESGHGLGLSIVQQLADAHGWNVSATDSETGGARFEFTGVSFVERD